MEARPPLSATSLGRSISSARPRVSRDGVAATLVSSQHPGTHDAIGIAERRLAAAIIAAAMLLRALYAFRYRVDSDEPQHLHVAWAWAHGLVQYRDVFDNHMPLFHLL